MTRRPARTLVLLTLVATLGPSSLRAAAPADQITTICSVGPGGEGNAQAQQALWDLSRADAAALPSILTGFDEANPLAANWLRSAFETIADRTLKNGGRLPESELERFVLDRKHNARARRLAYEWLAKVDEDAEDRIVPKMLKDPSPEMRRDAVGRLVARADKLKDGGKPDEAKDVYREALSGAVDHDQVKAITDALKTLGVEIDLQKHFGFLTRWHLVGPFEHRGGKGFDVAYPPEAGVDLKATYPTEYRHDGFEEDAAAWKGVSTDDPYGVIDIAKHLKNYHGSCTYAATDFTSSEARPVEFRLATPNAWKLWVNGKLLFAREEYHRGTALDQYRVRAELEPGRNEILLKVCQNEQTEDWAQGYQFQFRVVDASGDAVLPEDDTVTR